MPRLRLLSGRLYIGGHRIQLAFGDAAVVAAEDPPSPSQGHMVRVAAADFHHARAVAAGARILAPPAD